MTRRVSARHILAGLVLGVVAIPATAAAQEVGENGTTASFMIDEALAKRGKSIFQNKGCTACHAIGRRGAGPDLLGVTDRREMNWLTSFLKDPPAMLESDSIAIEMLKEYRGAKMPNLRLSDNDVQALIHYIAQETAKKQGG